MIGNEQRQHVIVNFNSLQCQDLGRGDMANIFYVFSASMYTERQEAEE